MNDFAEDGLRERLASATVSRVHPLMMRVVDVNGHERQARAVNEVSMLRQTFQAAKLRIVIDGKPRLEELVADGILVATPAGSTAYNLSVNGPILPLDAPLLAMTPISAFRPRRWRGALPPDRAKVLIEVLEAPKRPSPPSPITPNSAMSRACRSRWITKPTSCCCTIPAIPWKSAFSPSSSAP